MINYHEILVPYDTSKPSEIALEHAITIAKMSALYANTTINVIVVYVVYMRYLSLLLLGLVYLNQSRLMI
jgi:nucleotide-binding universal stress UspA family protein